MKNDWCCVCVFVVVVEDDVVNVYFEGGIDVFFDMLGREFVFNWNVFGLVVYFIGEVFYLVVIGLVWEVWW